ncbi:MAG: hypothetical protein RLZ98_3447 [Pseudomonadota bacterium]|jgi:hypothetical protein
MDCCNGLGGPIARRSGICFIQEQRLTSTGRRRTRFIGSLRRRGLYWRKENMRRSLKAIGGAIAGALFFCLSTVSSQAMPPVAAGKLAETTETALIQKVHGRHCSRRYGPHWRYRSGYRYRVVGWHSHCRGYGYYVPPIVVYRGYRRPRARRVIRRPIYRAPRVIRRSGGVRSFRRSAPRARAFSGGDGRAIRRGGGAPRAARGGGGASRAFRGGGRSGGGGRGGGRGRR